MRSGYATPQGTAAYAAGFPSETRHGFYGQAQSLTISTLGIGSQRSERNIGAAIARSGVDRQNFVICTKAGYLVPGAVPAHAGDVVANMHSMSPAFLSDQLQRSLTNLDLDCIDVFYLHNPETQLDHVPAEPFYERIRMAFEKLEALADEGKIRYYGAATWNGFRQQDAGLSLRKLVSIAGGLRGDTHRFRFIQLPFNLAMTEALSQRDAAGLNTLDHAAQLGVTVIASASLLQSRLTRGLPPVIKERLSGLPSDALRAIQFTRSTPGITTALVGMGRPSHVSENLAIAQVPPATPEKFLDLFR